MIKQIKSAQADLLSASGTLLSAFVRCFPPAGMNWVPPVYEFSVVHVYACSLLFTHCAAHCVY